MEILVILAIIGIPVFFIIGIYNRIIRNYNSCKRSWADVATYERQKVKILEGLEPLIEQYSTYEKGALEAIIGLRQNINDISTENIDSTTLGKIEAKTKELMSGLNVVVENYPELKANEIYLKYMDELTTQNENVGAAITIFNKNVELFNNSIQTFPDNIVNGSFNKKEEIKPFSDSVTDENIEYKPNF